MNNNTFVHKYIRPLINKEDIVADMTAGNGNDTFFLAQYAKKVYAFDISEKAIRRSKERCIDYDNIVFICDNHINIDHYINEKIRLFIFNLGYLPSSDETRITQADETLTAFDKAYSLLKEKGYIVITFYIGHPGGKDEYYLLKDHINKNRLHIIEAYHQDKIDSPITYIIRKT